MKESSRYLFVRSYFKVEERIRGLGKYPNRVLSFIVAMLRWSNALWLHVPTWYRLWPLGTYTGIGTPLRLKYILYGYMDP